MRRREFIKGFLALATAGAGLLPTVAEADHDQLPGRRRGRAQRRNDGGTRPIPYYQQGPSPDQDRARRALREGRVLPLGDIMGLVRRRYPGKVLDVDLVQDGRLYVYYLKVLEPSGRVLDVAVDGKSGRILDVRGRGR